MTGQTLLITGGSGTLGTALTRYALNAGAARVICLSRGEHQQAALAATIADPRLECWIGDVRDRDRLHWACRVRPDVVIHAAALKRAEVCEREPDEARKTNIDGTRNVVKEAMLANVPQVLVISSDKAACAELCYGATKRAAEVIALGQNRYRGAGATRISVVRYGNVLGSAGSFLEPLLAARQSGTPYTITDPLNTRFWWSLDDAVRFVARVLTQMLGDEIWVPKLVSACVVDVAQAVAPGVPWTVAGMRGIEKRHETMIGPSEIASTWDLGWAYVVLPSASSGPPAGAVRVPSDFRYTSDRDPLAVSFQALEAACLVPSAS